jgi:hypothetical protein
LAGERKYRTTRHRTTDSETRRKVIITC